MSGFVYLIRNKDLYKIGITQNLEQRMKALKPDEILSTMQAENYEDLEKQLHKKYSDVRIPQTEYFRLSFSQATECKEFLDSYSAGEEAMAYQEESTAEEVDWAKTPFFEYALYPMIFLFLPIFFFGGFFDLFSDASWFEIYKLPALKLHLYK